MAPTAREISVGTATPATPIFSTNTQKALPQKLMALTRKETFIETALLPVERKIAAPALYSAKNGKDSAVMVKYSSAACITSSAMVPNSSRSIGARVSRQNTATPLPSRALKPTSCPALRAASSGFLAPRYWLVTTAPPVASAPNTVMMSMLIISTSDTPEMAASPAEETIIVSAIPTSTFSACSMISGQSSVSSWRLEKIFSFCSGCIAAIPSLLIKNSRYSPSMHPV